VIVERAEKSDVPDIDKKKLALQTFYYHELLLSIFFFVELFYC
jgi:hypothetical protein